VGNRSPTTLDPAPELPSVIADRPGRRAGGWWEDAIEGGESDGAGGFEESRAGEGKGEVCGGSTRTRFSRVLLWKMECFGGGCRPSDRDSGERTDRRCDELGNYLQSLWGCIEDFSRDSQMICEFGFDARRPAIRNYAFTWFHNYVTHLLDGFASFINVTEAF
jgi:hypothetical protein